ncbi:MAG TPA: Ig-like domain-containing protein, partial [Blastocatellia bacterium]|nr:Ig-like domain-containing protein [Blastocatellia bacterium]
MNRTRVAISFLLVALLLGTTLPFSRSYASGQIVRRGAPRRPVASNAMGTGLEFRLSEGADQASSREQPPAAQATPLSDTDTASVLSRLPQPKTDAQDEQEFAFRERSLPPPRTGQTIAATFPPPDERATPDVTAAGPLEVLRHAPEGEVPLAPHLTVTFSQPMVAVTSQTEAAKEVPVRLTPEPPGAWRWIGTKTVLFEPDGRFPMATEYKVEIPAGTRSANGGTLATSSRWSFSTPPPQVKTSYPTDGPHPRKPVIFVEFDQRIDPAAVLRTIRVRSGRTTFNTRLARQDEVAA